MGMAWRSLLVGGLVAFAEHTTAQGVVVGNGCCSYDIPTDIGSSYFNASHLVTQSFSMSTYSAACAQQCINTQYCQSAVAFVMNLGVHGRDAQCFLHVEAANGTFLSDICSVFFHKCINATLATEHPPRPAFSLIGAGRCQEPADGSRQSFYPTSASQTVASVFECLTACDATSSGCNSVEAVSGSRNNAGASGFHCKLMNFAATSIISQARTGCYVRAVAPTPVPTAAPTTQAPTHTPTRSPTHAPTILPTSIAPTLQPTHIPTTDPTSTSPTFAPTEVPTTQAPTTAPTFAPTEVPTTVGPTAAPTFTPTEVPTTQAPTTAPTFAPTEVPTTVGPTAAPTFAPTEVPTTQAPTAAPTFSPTEAPTTQAPTTQAPTATPITAAPSFATDAPATAAPLASNFIAPTTAAPVATALEGSGSGDSGGMWVYVVVAIVAVVLVVIVIAYRRSSRSIRQTDTASGLPMPKEPWLSLRKKKMTTLVVIKNPAYKPPAPPRWGQRKDVDTPQVVPRQGHRRQVSQQDSAEDEPYLAPVPNQNVSYCEPGVSVTADDGSAENGERYLEPAVRRVSYAVLAADEDTYDMPPPMESGTAAATAAEPITRQGSDSSDVSTFRAAEFASADYSTCVGGSNNMALYSTASADA